MTPELKRQVRASLMRHEGLVLAAYDDKTGRVIQPGTTVGGWVTIGYGRNLVGRGITLLEAEHLLGNDLAAVELELDRLLPQWRTWSEPRQWALFELCYNLGAARFVREWPNTVAHLRAGRFLEVAGVLERSKWRAQVGDGRAALIIQAMKRGTWE